MKLLISSLLTALAASADICPPTARKSSASPIIRERIKNQTSNRSFMWRIRL